MTKNIKVKHVEISSGFFAAQIWKWSGTFYTKDKNASGFQCIFIKSRAGFVSSSIIIIISLFSVCVYSAKHFVLGIIMGWCWHCSYSSLVNPDSFFDGDDNWSLFCIRHFDLISSVFHTQPSIIALLILVVILKYVVTGNGLCGCIPSYSRSLL